MFIDQKMAAKYGFKLQKLERPIMVRNANGINNSARAITHQVEANVYYKGHVERMRMDVCNLGKTNIILGMPWLQAYNPEINWETGEVKITRCPPLCRRNMRLKEKRVRKKVKRVVTLEKEKIVRWAVDDYHDLAKWLKSLFTFLFFSFLFLSELTTQGWSMRKYHITKCHRVTGL